MDCLKLAELLRYFEAETTPGEAEEMRDHMKQCRHCRQEAGAVQQLLQQVETWAHGAEHAPGPDEACLDTLTLASYLDRRLPRPERAQVERHLARCQDCLEAHMAAVQRLESVADALTTASAPRAERQTSTAPWQALGRRLQAWRAALTPSPPWLLAGSGIAVAAILVLYVLRASWYAPGGTVAQAPPRQPSGYGFGTATDVLVQGTVRLSPDLRRALRAYAEDPATPTREVLLALLRQAPVPLPVERVQLVEVKPALRRAVTAEPVAGQQIRVTLLHDGLLLLEEAP